jgi:hypothetical protein
MAMIVAASTVAIAADLADGMAQIVSNLDYANFKNEVARHDPARAHVYGDVWGVLGGLQPGGPYST